MLELSLFSQIPYQRHGQVLKLLAGIAAMAPVNTLERHIIHKPVRQAHRASTQLGASQGIQDAQKAGRQGQTQAGGDIYYLRLVEDLAYEGVDWERGAKLAQEAAMTKADEAGRWSLRFYDVPEAGRRSVMARTTSATPIQQGDAFAFMKGLGYQAVYEYVVQGQQFVHNNVVLHLHRAMSATNSQNHDADYPRDLLPVDESGAYILHAYVRVQDGTVPDVVSKGTAELMQLKELLRGAIDLRVVDRLSLDTRVK